MSKSYNTKKNNFTQGPLFLEFNRKIKFGD